MPCALSPRVVVLLPNSRLLSLSLLLLHSHLHPRFVSDAFPPAAGRLEPEDIGAAQCTGRAMRGTRKRACACDAIGDVNSSTRSR